MHSNTKAQHLPKSTALLYNLSYQLVLQPTAPGYILQVLLRITIQNQIRIAQWVIVDEIVQLCPLRHGHIQRILYPGAVNGNSPPIPEQQLHTPGIHIKLADSFIVLHVRFLLKSCCGLCRSIYDFGFHLPRMPALNFPKKTNNPNPSPIGNKFGLFLFGPSGENRTHGLLNPIVLLSKTQCTIRYCLDSVSLNFKCIIPFCFIGCQDVSFLLWSNCGQTNPTNDLSPPAKLHRAISIFINRSCAFCLHELSIRRTCQPCQRIIVVFSSLTELYDP